MADDAHVIQGINWRQTFPFTHLFRSFRIAIHPSKLILALALLVLVFAGGLVLDALWPKKHLVPERNQIDLYRFGTILTSETPPPGKVGIFCTFIEHQIRQVNNVSTAVLANNWMGGQGVFDGVYNFLIRGPVWLFVNHPLFAILFFLWFLLIWSIFGGAICRIAAVHAARDEKISVRQALKFSISKVLSFLFAPIIPLLIVGVVGLLVTAGALLNNILWIGPIIVGVLFFLALAAGFIMTLVLLGTVGGFNLMYPTIAVEGSDSFDAISRSFSYLYARPWRLAFYTAVAIGYGALTYLFIRLFIFLMLFLTHQFADLGSMVKVDRPLVEARTGAQLDPADELWDKMWPVPQMDNLTYHPSWYRLNGGSKIGAGVLMFWVYLVIAMLGAYAVSFYFSSNTIIYYLMRQEVDATEMDDVYVEQSEEDFAEPAPLTSTTTVTTTVIPAPSAVSSVGPTASSTGTPGSVFTSETPSSDTSSTTLPSSEGETRPPESPTT